jgi:hypothetical protein
VKFLLKIKKKNKKKKKKKKLRLTEGCDCKLEVSAVADSGDRFM